MKDWIQRKEVEKFDLLRLAAASNNLPDYMIEKDWWVTSALEGLFTSEISKHLSFKGGTSLSKSWSILKRFSEDIDIVIDKKLFGVADNVILGSGAKTRLRKGARKYIIEKVKPLLQSKLENQNIPLDVFKLTEESSGESDTDPTVLLLEYKSLTEIPNDYTKPIVKIEIGVRAMSEPTEDRKVSSLLAQAHSPGEVINVNTVLPKRTFWEKAFLLHELFQKPLDKMNLLRLSRHWYDLHCLFETGFGKEAVNDPELYMAIRSHRKNFTKTAGVDYDKLLPKDFNLNPPKEKKEEWSRDYGSMSQSYIYDGAPTLEVLEQSIGKVTEMIRTTAINNK
jgi:Nucleotidyl transferase AbiEii toxin, Type IV TA system